MAAPTVKIQEGVLQGKISQNFRGGDFFSFLGIPYAKPPIGDLRFKAPQPAESWIGIRDVSKEGPESPSRHLFFTNYVGDEENCLHLNVFTKQLPSKIASPKPVMVWIHGGAFLHGSNKSEIYGPNYLMIEDIVLVHINYRLGALGFLSLEDPSLGVPGNAGLKDMVLALKWVQNNIVHFNGDPENVTIFGESAGSAAVHYLYVSPLAKGLFHKCIMQSGCALNSWARGCNNGKLLAENLGYNENDERKILEYLKTVPAKKLVKAQHVTLDDFAPSRTRPFGPVVENNIDENTFLPEDPIDIIKNKKFNDVPILIGYNSNEGMFFAGVRKILPGVKMTNDFQTEIPFDLNLEKDSNESIEVARRIQKFYYDGAEPTEKNIDKLFLLKTDTQFLYGIQKSINLHKLHSSQPLYFYRMALDTSLNYYKQLCSSKAVSILIMLYYLSSSFSKINYKNFFLKLTQSVPRAEFSGVCHADDLSYLFTSLMAMPIEKNSVEELSIKRFVKMWTNFAKFGNPTPYENHELLNNVKWLPVTKTDNHFLDINVELKCNVNPDKDRVEFWNSIYDSY